MSEPGAGSAEMVYDIGGGKCAASSSEDYRRYCEARFALSLPDKSDKRRKGWQAISKREYLQRVKDRRGEQGAKVLRDEMVRLWKLSSQANQR